jgi:hypothetical protein
VAGILWASSVEGQALPGFVAVAQTQHFSFYSRDGLKVDASKSEKFLARVEQQLGHRVSGRAPYYRHERPEEVAAYSGTYASGITDLRTGTIHSIAAFHPHEIVHRVAGELGNPGLFFHEGLAVALGDRGKLGGRGVQRLARTILERSRFERFLEPALWRDEQRRQPAYAVAGAFMEYLIETYGLETVAGFFRACRTPLDARAAFARSFGQPLESAGLAWLATLGLDPAAPSLRTLRAQGSAPRDPTTNPVAAAPDAG